MVGPVPAVHPGVEEQQCQTSSRHEGKSRTFRRPKPFACAHDDTVAASEAKTTPVSARLIAPIARFRIP